MTDYSAENKGRKRALLYEVVIALSILWVPSVLTGLRDFFDPVRVHSTPVGSLYSVIMDVARIALPVFLVWNNGEPLKKLGLRRPRPSDLMLALMVFAMTIVIERGGYALVRPLWHLAGALTYRRPHFSYSPVLLAVQVSAAVAFEEVLCRGYLCTRLMELSGKRSIAILVSAAIFALPHIYQGWLPLPVHFAFGVLYATLFLRYRVLWPLIAAHAAYDLHLFP